MRILLVADRPGWAYDILAKSIKKHSAFPEIEIQYIVNIRRDTTKVDFSNYDVVFFFLWYDAMRYGVKISGFEFKRSISAERFHHYNELSDILRNGRLSDGENMSLSDYHYLFDHLEKHKHMINNKISSYDCIISPSALGEALSGLEYTGSPVLNTTWTLLGLPSITLPMFKSKNNLPIGSNKEIYI